MTLRLYGPNAKIWMTQQGTATADVGINLAGEGNSLVARRGAERLFAVEAAETEEPMSIPVPFNILTMFPDRLKESRLVLVPYTPNSLVVRTLYGESIDKALDGSYIPRVAENCPGHSIALACYYQIVDLSSTDPLNSFDIPSTSFADVNVQKGEAIISQAYAYERILGFNLLEVSSYADGSTITGGFPHPSPSAVLAAADQPNFNAVKATEADLQRLWAQLLALKDSIRGAAPNCKHTSKVSFLAASSGAPANHVDADGAEVTYELDIFDWVEMLFNQHFMSTMKLSGHADAYKVAGDPTSAIDLAWAVSQDKWFFHVTQVYVPTFRAQIGA